MRKDYTHITVILDRSGSMPKSARPEQRPRPQVPTPPVQQAPQTATDLGHALEPSAIVVHPGAIPPPCRSTADWLELSSTLRGTAWIRNNPSHLRAVYRPAHATLCGRMV